MSRPRYQPSSRVSLTWGSCFRVAVLVTMFWLIISVALWMIFTVLGIALIAAGA